MIEGQSSRDFAVQKPCSTQPQLCQLLDKLSSVIDYLNARFVPAPRQCRFLIPGVVH